MSRKEQLQRKAEKAEAIEEVAGRYKDPEKEKYILCSDSGNSTGIVEYNPETDSIAIDTLDACGKLTIRGCYLKSLRDILNKLLDE